MAVLILATKYINLFVALSLIVRLVLLRLFSPYRVFAFFLLYDLTISLGYVAIPWRELYTLHQIDYRVVWLIERPLAWILHIWVVLAILRKIMAEHLGILRLSRRLLVAAFAGAILVAWLSAHFGIVESTRSDLPLIDTVITNALIIERASLITSLVLLASMLTFLLWFPVRISRNVAVVCGTLLIYFASSAAVYAFPPQAWSDHVALMVSLALYLIDTACLLVWLVYLNRSGEDKVLRVGHAWKPDEQKRLLDKLESINKALSQPPAA